MMSDRRSDSAATLSVNKSVGKSFEQTLDSNKPTLVNYYAYWCGYSKKFQPKWEEFKGLAKSKFPNLQVIDLDVGNDDNLNDLAGQVGVKGYPTVVLFYKDKIVSRGSGDAKDIIKFVEDNMN